MTNLLPQEEKQLLKREYFLRIGIVSSFALAGVFILGSITLLPSLFIAGAQRSIVEQQESIIADSLSSRESRAALGVIDDTNYKLTRLSEASPRFVPAVEKAVRLAPGGTTLSSFALGRNASGNATLTVSGVSPTRDRLQAYERILDQEPGIIEVVLPIGSLAESTDIPFSITMTLLQ